MKSLGLLLAAMLAFSGQTPAAAPRHLEYAFSVSPTVGDAGGSGTLSVDVLDQASGVVSVHASQLWTNGVRAQQIADCDVSAGGGFACAQLSWEGSLAERVLLPLLASDFFSGASSAGSKWNRSYHVGGGSVYVAATMDLEAGGSSDGRVLPVTLRGTSAEIGKICYCAGNSRHKWDDEGSIAYDLAGKIPAGIRDTRTYEPTKSVFSQQTVVLQLTKDSATTVSTQ
jgi:hypothetical protein